MTDDLRHVQAMWAQDRASAALDSECTSVSHDGTLGVATARMTVTETMVNGHDICHGGLVFTLADSTFALAFGASLLVTVAATVLPTLASLRRPEPVVIARLVAE